MSSYWDSFIESVPWFVDAGVAVDARPSRKPGHWAPASSAFETLFPSLAGLLRAAWTTDVRIGDAAYTLFSWPTEDWTPAWLCRPPEPAPALGVFPAHAVLLASFGGIVERADEPDTWLLNHNEVLTTAEAAHDASFLSAYASAFPDERLPLDTAAYYSIAGEANGNTTLCNRESGHVLLFAHDHSFKHIVPWRGCPEYTLYDIEGAPDFQRWVEIVAAQWLDATREAG